MKRLALLIVAQNINLYRKDPVSIPSITMIMPVLSLIRLNHFRL
ncbi:MAG: hypothetical protein ACR2GD_00450 [Pyrinomonadaceae bacterium]